MALTRPGKVLLVACLLFSPLSTLATELLGPEQGVIPFGMGRAYSAVADDWLALHYNPAGLALVNRVDIQVFDLRLGSNRDVLQNYSSLSNLGKSSQSSIANTLSQYAGKHVMAVVGNTTQLTVPHAALALTYDAHTDFDMENLSNPKTQMRFTRDLAFRMGGAIAAGGGKQKNFRLGTSLAFIRRTGGTKDIKISDISGSKASLADRFTATGSGIGGTLGMQVRLPTPGRADYTASFVWHDIGQTSFGGEMSQNRPTRIDQNMVAGMAARFPIGGRTNRRAERRYGNARSSNHLTFAFDYSHLNLSWNKEHLPKHIHLGLNLDLPILSLQLGMNQTSFTAGTSFDLGILRVALATYGEELGSYAGQKRDRRYLVSVGSSLGFKGF